MSPRNGLTVAEVAVRLGFPRSVVYALCEAGVLAHVRISNAIWISPEDLAAYLARQRRGAP